MQEERYNMKKIMSMILVLALVLTSINFVKAPKTVEASEGAGDYYIQVNKGTNVVTVFKKKDNKPYKEKRMARAFRSILGTVQYKNYWWFLIPLSLVLYKSR